MNETTRPGEPFYGGPGTGDESYLGHLRVVEDGRRCSCGDRGCLETLVAEPYLAPQRASIHGTGRAFTDVRRGLSDLAEAGSIETSTLEDTMVEHLGATIATIVHLFTPELALVGGNLAALPPVDFTRLDGATRDRTFPLLLLHETLRLETADSGGDSLIRGAAASALEVLHYS